MKREREGEGELRAAGRTGAADFSILLLIFSRIIT